MALASGLAVSVMLLTKTTHPPAGANPLLIMMTGQNWDFLLTPVLLGAVSIVVICQGMQKALKVQAS
ncbi:HPP family protein [Vibrio vulnificus]|nr:HPP family protein [Vibrio vulnificus]